MNISIHQINIYQLLDIFFSLHMKVYPSPADSLLTAMFVPSQTSIDLIKLLHGSFLLSLRDVLT